MGRSITRGIAFGTLFAAALGTGSAVAQAPIKFSTFLS